MDLIGGLLGAIGALLSGLLGILGPGLPVPSLPGLPGVPMPGPTHMLGQQDTCAGGSFVIDQPGEYRVGSCEELRIRFSPRAA